MPLQIQSICLRDFRLYHELRLDGIGRLTVFVGPNAVGKTSIIEGIQLLTALSSLRHSSAEEMIRFGSESARVEAQVGDGNRQLDIALSLSGKSRKYTLNGKAKRVRDLRGMVPAVTFSPDDLELVKGSHGKRRHALDQLGVQLNANYLQLVHDFEKMQRHKNKLLKEEAPLPLLEAVNETFARVSAQLTNYRRRMFERLLPHMQRMYGKIADSEEEGVEELTGTYRASWEIGENQPIVDEEAGNTSDADSADSAEAYAQPDGNGPQDLQEAIRSRTPEERARRRALEGAHLDKIDFAISGMDAQRFASQGQQRSLVLAWKLAEVDLVEEMLGQPPILLLDDVMSELDSTRRAALIQYLSSDLQTFITTANEDYFTEEMLAEANIIHLPLD